MLTSTLIFVAILLAVVGLIGCLVPVLPGTPLSYAALLLISYALQWRPFSLAFLALMALAMLAVMLLEYVFPLAGAKRFGASRAGLVGSVGGMLLGIFVFPPWGLILGAFAGAMAGELAAGKDVRTALRAGWGLFIGNLVSTAVKLTYAGAVLFLCVRALF